MLFTLQPMDIVAVHGLWYMPHHKLIKWRSLDETAHCVVVRTSNGDLYNPTFTGIKTTGTYSNLKFYSGRTVSILRYNKEFDPDRLIAWCNKTVCESKGYDFFCQWITGFVLGITAKQLADNPKAWTCAEFPYWAFQECGYQLTSKDEILPFPRLFRYSKEFNLIYEGVI